MPSSPQALLFNLLKTFCKGALWVCGATIIGVGIFFLRLSYGPISLNFAHPYVDSWIKPYGVTPGNLTLAWLEKNLFSLQAEKVRGRQFSAQNLQVLVPLNALLLKPGSVFTVKGQGLVLDFSSQGGGSFDFIKMIKRLAFLRLDLKEIEIKAPLGGKKVRWPHLSLQWEGQKGVLLQGNEEVAVFSYTPQQDQYHFSLSLARLSLPLKELGEGFLTGNLGLEGKVQAVVSPSTWHWKGSISQSPHTTVYLKGPQENLALSSFSAEGQGDPHQIVLTQSKVSVNEALFLLKARMNASHIQRLTYLEQGKTQSLDPRVMKAQAHLGQGFVSIQDLPALWPKDIGESAREWVLANFRQGKIPLLQAQITMKMPEKGDPDVTQFQGKLGIKDTVLTFMENMPAITSLEAVSDVTLGGFDIQILGGLFSQHTLEKGQILIHPLKGVPDLDLDLTLKGPFKALVNIMSRFSSLKDMPLKKIKGTGTTRLKASFPLLADLKKEQMKMDLSSLVEKGGFRLKAAGKEIKVRDGTFQIEGNQEDLVVKGKSYVNDIPARWVWKGDENISFSAALPALQLGKLVGVDLSSYIQGFIYVKGENNKKKLYLQADLKEAACNLPWIKWHKPKGIPLSCTMDSPKNASRAKLYELGIKGALAGGAHIETDQGKISFLKGECRTSKELARYHYANHHHRLFFRGETLQFGKSSPPTQQTPSFPKAKVLPVPLKQPGPVLCGEKAPPEPFTRPKKFSAAAPSQIMSQGSPGERTPRAPYTQPAPKPGPSQLAVKMPSPSSNSSQAGPGRAAPSAPYTQPAPKPGPSQLAVKTPSPSSNSSQAGPGRAAPSIPYTQPAPKHAAPRVSSASPQGAQEVFSVDLECGEIGLQEVNLSNCHVRAQARVLDSRKPWMHFSNLKWDYGSAFATILHRKARHKKMHEGPLMINLFPKPHGEVVIHIETANLGAVLKGLGLTRTVKGGSLILKARQDAKGDYKGRVEINSVVTRVPILGKVLAMVSPMMFTELFSRGLLFYNVSSSFYYEKGLLRIVHGIGKGINLGLALRGGINTEAQKVDLKGTIIPSYLLNTLFSYVPVLGWVFGGHQGLVSTEFSLKGPFENPSVGIEPLSIFKIGFIKDLFRPAHEGEEIKEEDLAP